MSLLLRLCHEITNTFSIKAVVILREKKELERTTRTYEYKLMCTCTEVEVGTRNDIFLLF